MFWHDSPHDNETHTERGRAAEGVLRRPGDGVELGNMYVPCTKWKPIYVQGPGKQDPDLFIAKTLPHTMPQCCERRTKTSKVPIKCETYIRMYIIEIW